MHIVPVALPLQGPPAGLGGAAAIFCNFAATESLCLRLLVSKNLDKIGLRAVNRLGAFRQSYDIRLISHGSLSQGSAALHPGLLSGRPSGAWFIVLQTASQF